MKKMIQQLKNKKGFTLIELIVVIAIIAILAAVLIPRFAGFTESAQKNAVTSDARNILLAVEAMNAEGMSYADIEAQYDAATPDGDVPAYCIDTYTGKAYFNGGTCKNFAITPTAGYTESTATGFTFVDTQNNKEYTATVTFADSEISVSDGVTPVTP